MSTPPATENDVRRLVWDLVHRIPAVDAAVGFHDPRFGDRLGRASLDALLDAPALVAEYHRRSVGGDTTPLPFDAFERPLPGCLEAALAVFADDSAEAGAAPSSAYAGSAASFEEWPLPARAAALWRTLFMERAPLSEPARAALTSLGMLGFDCARRDWAHYRAAWAALPPADAAARAFAAANVSWAAMPNDPLDPDERAVWDAPCPPAPDPRFRASLWLDNLAHSWKTSAVDRLAEWGYDVAPRVDKRVAAEVRRFLADWIDRARPVYASLRVSARFDPDHRDALPRLLRKAILPLMLERGLPVWLHWSPAFGALGDSAPDDALFKLMTDWPGLRWIVSADDPDDRAALMTIAAHAQSLPVLYIGVDDTPAAWNASTERAVSLLGADFAVYASGADALATLPGRWARMRWRLGLLLQEQYTDLWRTGWRPTAADLERDIRDLLGDRFARFIGHGGK